MSKIVLVFLLGLALVLVPTEVVCQKVQRDSEPFDIYKQSISWKSEVIRLDNLAIYMQRFPRTVAYIGFYGGVGAPLDESKRRAEKARRYMTSKRKIDDSRILVVCAGTLDKPTTVIYLREQGDLRPAVVDCGDKNLP